MPRHQKTMKDVAACDKLRGGGKQPLSRRFPNGVTRCEEMFASSLTEIKNRLMKTTWGTETS